MNLENTQRRKHRFQISLRVLLGITLVLGATLGIDGPTMLDVATQHFQPPSHPSPAAPAKVTKPFTVIVTTSTFDPQLQMLSPNIVIPGERQNMRTYEAERIDMMEREERFGKWEDNWYSRD